MSSENNTTTHAEVIKLGVDIHAGKYVVARQIDGASPQAPQRFTPEQFLAWAKQGSNVEFKYRFRELFMIRIYSCRGRGESNFLVRCIMY